MRVYEVKVERVGQDGRRIGWERIALVINENRGREIAQEWVEGREVNQWWMAYGENAEGHINVVVEELGEVIE